MIQVENLSKHFKKFVAVDRVSFRVDKGEVLGLLGPNGAGKTTIMRVIATLLTPARGTVRVDGYDIHTHPHEVRGALGILPEYWGLYERFTPRENLRMFGTFYGMKGPSLERRIDELIDLFGMHDYADRECKRFSKGMSQKVALARCMIHNPSNLLLDEPTSGLDVMSARQVRKLISDSREQGRCVIVSTHILSEAERLCDRLILLDGGRVVAEETPESLCKRANKENLEDAFLSLLGRQDVEVIS
jgi:sodium transport system ATP-binding protein